MANGTGHKILTHAAIGVLPDWEQKLLAPVRAKLETEYSMYGDAYFINPSEIGPYIELPDGRLPMDPWEIRHFRKDGPGDDYYTCGYYDLMRYSFEYFAEECIKCIECNDLTSFAKFTGSIAHIIQDCGTPAHAVGTTMSTDMKMIKLLYPAPDIKKMVCQLHFVLENTFKPFSLKYKPKLLGCTPSEISFNLLERFTDMLEFSISFINPILAAFYKDDHEGVAELLTECGQYPSKVLADFIHSVIAVGMGQLDSNEQDKLKNATLSEYTPSERSAWAPAPYQYAEIRKSPWGLNDQYEPVPLTLLIDGKEKIFKKGFGIGPPYQITYLLPKNVYKQFNSTIGIHSKLGTESGVTFKVLGDGIELTRGQCNTINDTLIINCNIANVHKLTLEITPSGDIPCPSNSHAIWGKPQLLKNNR